MTAIPLSGYSNCGFFCLPLFFQNKVLAHIGTHRISSDNTVVLPPGNIGLFIPLLLDKGTEEAIRQIKEREYVLRFRGRVGRILAVRIGYDRESKEYRRLVRVFYGYLEIF